MKVKFIVLYVIVVYELFAASFLFELIKLSRVLYFCYE